MIQILCVYGTDGTYDTSGTDCIDRRDVADGTRDPVCKDGTEIPDGTDTLEQVLHVVQMKQLTPVLNILQLEQVVPVIHDAHTVQLVYVVCGARILQVCKNATATGDKWVYIYI